MSRSNYPRNLNGRRGLPIRDLVLLVALLISLAPIKGASPALAAAPQAMVAPDANGRVAPVSDVAAATDIVRLRVVSARTEPLALDGAGVVEGQPVSTPYKFMISVDNTGDPFSESPDCYPYLDPPANTVRNPDYPAGCDWPGVRTNPAWTPIYTQGDHDDLNQTTGIQLPPGKYLISVMAEGFKVDGEHFVIPLQEPGLIEVGVQPFPLPSASMVIQVFHDRAMTSSQFDAPAERSVCPGEMCMAGFRALLNDIAGEITVDNFGNPLCTEYEKDGDGEIILDGDGAPIPIFGTGGECLSDENGWIHIPNIMPIRYDVLVVPPDGETWIQTTTLEGSHGWDTWLQEGGTGLDNEFIVAAEPFPWTIFGFVKPTAPLPPIANGGSVEGVIMGITNYSPSQGGLPHYGDIWGGLMGAKLDVPVERPWISLNSLQDGDVAIWVGEGNADGSFFIENVPPGDYFMSYWDYRQHYILDWVQITVRPNEVTDVGVRTVTNWFTHWSGHVFHDLNENGRRDPGEPGVPDFLITLRDRDNTKIDRMSIAAMTDINGFWALEKGYPMSFWMSIEAFHELYRTTGVTVQASNAKEPTTVIDNIVNLHVLPIFSQAGSIDWGVTFYEEGTNGGIAGTVFYDTVRAEDDARYAGAEPWQPGIPDLEMRLFATVKDEAGNYLFEADGSYRKGPLLASTITEDFVRPKNCQALDVDGDPVDFPALPPSEGDYDCLEGPMMGVQFGMEQGELPGNFGFEEIDADPVTGEALAEPMPIPNGDYLVEVVIPTDPVFGRPLYQVTREEDLNIFDGDILYPQVLPPACAGPLHVVDVAGIPPDGPNAVHNPGYAAEGGSRFEGKEMPLCNVKLVPVVEQKAIAPIFTLWTEVPIPGRWRGYIIDDLNVSSNPFEMFFGEKMGLAHMPIGVYDFSGRLVHTVHSDFHGVYEVILPSSATYNAPTPSGMFASMYYIYGNDPGQPGAFNELHHSGYRSIGTSFEIHPGVTVPSDLAPTQNGALIWAPGSMQSQLATCRLDAATPELFAVSRPYASRNETITIYGKAFGATRGQGQVRLGNTTLPVMSWSDRAVTVRVPPNIAMGTHQLSIRASNLQSSVNGLTIHVLGQGYDPAVLEVGPGKTYATIQAALDQAATLGNTLVVVYPGEATLFDNPLGFWLENPIIYSSVKLQGVGPGGVYPDGTGVPGSILDGRGMGGTEDYAEWWRLHAGDIWLNRGGWDGSPVDGDGNPRLFEGAVVTVFAEDGEFTSAFPPSIDGFKIQGGDQQGFPNNLFQIGGGRIPGVPAQVVVQGGGIYVNAYARYMRITNNIIENNGGSYAGAIRIGTPDVPEPLTDHQNDNMFIGYNRILGNGGTNLAGGIGLFAGAENYEVAYNDICGNFSAEYGGGISHYGYSPNGSIHHNRIYFNRSYDEGGGIMIAGELPAIPGTLSPGAGPVNVYANLIQANLANDDGGGLRLLMAGNFMYNVYNNIIVNNVSTHEGGGVSLNDAPNVRVFNNTIMKNITTATAMTSNGLPMPAGLSTSRNSNMLQATLGPSAPIFSDPLLFNNIFWDNRAGMWTGGGIAGIGLDGDPSPIFHWDLGVGGGYGMLSPTHSLLHVPYGAEDPTNIIGQNPLVVSEYDSTVRVFPWRGNPSFVGADIVAFELPPNLMGDYHLTTGSPANNAGVASKNGVPAPNQDYDGQPRPSQGRFEIGADEVSQAFPATPQLFPNPGFAATPMADATVAMTMPLAVWLPLVRNGATTPMGIFGGDQASFEFDPVEGIIVKQSGYAYWGANVFDSDQEVVFTFVDVSSTALRQDLLLKIRGLTASGAVGPSSSLINVGYDGTTGLLTVSTLEPGDVWVTQAVFGGIEFASGDQFGARASRGGVLQVYQNGILIGSVDLSSGAEPWSYNNLGGRIGVWFEGPGFDGEGAAAVTGFGGGTPY